MKVSELIWELINNSDGDVNRNVTIRVYDSAAGNVKDDDISEVFNISDKDRKYIVID